MLTLEELLNESNAIFASVESSTNALEAARTMRELDQGCVVVKENGVLAGLLTQRDLVDHVLADNRRAMDVRVGDLMQRDIMCADPSWTVHDALERMTNRHLNYLPVGHREHVVGVVSFRDIILCATRQLGREVADIVDFVSAPASVHDTDRVPPPPPLPDQLAPPLGEKQTDEDETWVDGFGG